MNIVILAGSLLALAAISVLVHRPGGGRLLLDREGWKVWEAKDGAVYVYLGDKLKSVVAPGMAEELGESMSSEELANFAVTWTLDTLNESKSGSPQKVGLAKAKVNTKKK